MDPTLEKLFRQPLLDPLDEADLEQLREVVNVRAYTPQEVVFRQGDPAQHFYLVSDGQFEVLWDNEEGQSQRINLLYPGEFFGDVSLRDGEPRGVTVRAATPGEVLYIGKRDFRALLHHYPALEQSLAVQGQTIEARGLTRFDGQASDEVVLYFERRHWMALVRRSVKILVALFIMLLVLAAGAFVFREAVQAQTIFAVVWLVALVGPLGWSLWEFLDWYNDQYIVTDCRVIHIERVIGLLNQRYEVPLDKVQNVTVAHATPVAEWLGYGKVIIATAAQGQTTGTLIFDYMPQADLIAERILHELNKQKSQVSNEEQERKRRALRSALGMEPHTEPSPNPTEPPPPPSSENAAGIGTLLTRLGFFLRPIMREQRGSTIIWRKHWLILLVNSAPAYVLLFALVSGTGVAQLALDLTATASATIWFLSSVLLVFNLLWLLWLYVDWRNDLYILTNDAILDEEKTPLGFNQETRRAPLDTIQDIRFVQNNPLMVWFGVGNVLIQTAGQQGHFTFDWVQDPRGVQTDIFQYIQERKQSRQRQEAAAINNELVDLIKIYEEERNRAGRRTPRPAPDPADPDATRPSASM